jgi:Protein of unknown function (DUF3750)
MSRKILKSLSVVVLIIGIMASGPLVRMAFDTSALAADWRTASTAPVGWAPDPATYQPAVVQAYAARLVRWRGAFADHCWIAVKAPGASTYRRYEVIGFNLRRNRPLISETETPTPDQRWYGEAPILLQDIRGADAEKIIAALPAAVAAYPHPNTYRSWPGPNSNTFVAHLARAIPELDLVLPGRAIGKDYLMSRKLFAAAPSGSGFQLSLGGLFGVLIARREGIEVNMLGLVIGADPLDLALTIPGVGRIPSRSNWAPTEWQGTSTVLPR